MSLSPELLRFLFRAVTYSPLERSATVPRRNAANERRETLVDPVFNSVIVQKAIRRVARSVIDIAILFSNSRRVPSHLNLLYSI